MFRTAPKCKTGERAAADGVQPGRKALPMGSATRRPAARPMRPALGPPRLTCQGRADGSETAAEERSEDFISDVTLSIAVKRTLV